MKIMLVDDDRLTGLSLTKTLMEDYVVNLVTDEQTALKVAKAYDYDLILLNSILTHGDSIQLCEDLRSDGYQGLIFMLSCNSSQESQSECRRSLEVGANDYLTHPYQKDELLEKLHTLLHP